MLFNSEHARCGPAAVTLVTRITAPQSRVVTEYVYNHSWDCLLDRAVMEMSIKGCPSNDMGAMI